MDTRLHTSFTIAELTQLRDHAHHILMELVTPEGIYASTDDGWMGPYHSWFGRDGAITLDLISAAQTYGGDAQLADTGRQGLLALAAWQGRENTAATGEEFGKIPHEIRTNFNQVHKVQHASNTNQEPWFIDPTDDTLKNWDSADSTPLWIISIIRAHQTLHMPLEKATLLRLYNASQWILQNLKKYDGLIGFVGADEQPNRVYSGLHNQGWKDSFQIYQTKQGLSPHPIKDVLVNAEAWSALCYASEALQEYDTSLSNRLMQAAGELNNHFNSTADGFLLDDESYYAQAIDGHGTQLTQIAIDPAMSLWAYFGNACAIDSKYIKRIIERVTSPSMLNPLAGIRNYAVGTDFYQGTYYHGSPNTYWPFASAMVARGLLHFSYPQEAIRVIEGYLSAVRYFGSNIEMFCETPEHKLIEWHHPHVGQQSAIEQAWTAAAVYFGTHYLLSLY